MFGYFKLKIIFHYNNSNEKNYKKKIIKLKIKQVDIKFFMFQQMIKIIIQYIMMVNK